MKRFLGWLMVSFVFVLIGSYVWTLRHRMVAVVAARGDSAAPIHEQALPTYAEARQAQEMITVAGPIADYMSRQKQSHVETLQPTPYKAASSYHASDHIGSSPVGTSRSILHKTFGVVDIAKLPFEIPAHASNPQLRGSYRSFLAHEGPPSGEATADVEFLLLNEQQYAEFVSGHPGEALFSADAGEEVAAGMPPTLDEPATYHLVFRNHSRDTGKKLVQAEFRIDF
jgi:hypothetical protein